MSKFVRRNEIYPVSPQLNVATWNVAGINNNPFEYWVTYPDPAYNNFMQGVERIISNVSEDVFVNKIFTDCMFSELMEELEVQKIPKLNLLTELWENDYRNRYAIHGYLKDKIIGEKRLASMPDRITNTINCADGTVLRRPTVINAYDESSLNSIEAWWESWRKFIFRTHVQIFSRDNRNAAPQLVCELIAPILRSKYPAITAHEQEMSVPLQILCLAILDAIFIHIVNRAAPETWEEIRSTLSHALIHGKDDRVCSIIREAYTDRAVFFLQEASAALVRKSRQDLALSARYALLLPENFDGKRDQNSIILVDRRRFRAASARDVTQQVIEHIGGKFLEAGDLCVASVEDESGLPWLLVSFHGDSNGLSTHPVLSGVHRAYQQLFRDHVFLAGVDANTASHASGPLSPGVGGFRRLLRAQRMVSVWDGVDDPFVKTTCSARTGSESERAKEGQ
jgi:hypothetical protein